MSEQQEGTVRKVITTTTNEQLKANSLQTHERETSASPQSMDQGLEVGEDKPKDTVKNRFEVNEVKPENGVEVNEVKPEDGNSDETTDDEKAPGPAAEKNYEVTNPENDPDWGSYDDDKIKIQDGDIIEYLLKEWLLESAAWGINKTSGLLGAGLYNLTRRVGGKAKEHFRTGVREARKDLSHLYHDVRDQRQIQAIHDRNVKDLNNLIEKLNKLSESTPDVEAFAHVARGIGKRQIILKDGKFIDISANPPKKLHINPKLTPEIYNQIRKSADDAHIEHMCRELGISKNDKEAMKNLTKFYEEMTKAATRTDYNKDFVAEPDNDIINGFVSSHPNAVQAFNNARNQYNENGQPPHASIALTLLTAQANVFAEHYSQYKIGQDSQKSKEEEYNKALKMFWQLQQARRKEGSKIPSNDVLIKKAEKLKDKKSKEDEIDAIYKEQIDETSRNTEPQTLSESFEGYQTTAAILKADLKTMEDELRNGELKKEDIDRRRKLVEAAIKNINSQNQPSQERTQNTQSTEETQKKEEYIQNMTRILRPGENDKNMLQNDESVKRFRLELKILSQRDPKAFEIELSKAYDLYTGPDKNFDRTSPMYKVFQAAQKMYNDKHPINTRHNTRRSGQDGQ